MKPEITTENVKSNNFFIFKEFQSKIFYMYYTIKSVIFLISRKVVALIFFLGNLLNCILGRLPLFSWWGFCFPALFQKGFVSFNYCLSFVKDG